MMAKAKKKLLSKNQYAKHRGVSHTAVSKAVKAGRIPTTPDGLIDPESADKEWEKNTDPSKPLNSITGDPKRRKGEEKQGTGAATALPSDVPPIAVSLAAKEAIRTEREKIKLLKERNKLVSVDKVRADSFAVFRLTQEKLLNIPDRLAPVLAATNDSREIHRLLVCEIRLVCEDLRNDIKKLPGV